MRLWALIILLILAGCASEETPVEYTVPAETISAAKIDNSTVPEATITCEYMYPFNISEDATDDELAEKAHRNVFNPIGLTYDKGNEYSFLNCTSTGREMTCAHKGQILDCWWLDGEFVEVSCGPYPNGTITVKKDASAEAVTRKVMNTLFDSGYYDYLSRANKPGCALNNTCVVQEFICGKYTCRHSEKGLGEFGCY